MSEIDQLIETANRLSNTLSMIANNEMKYGWELGMKLEQLSYETYKTANDLKEIRSCLVGGVA